MATEARDASGEAALSSDSEDGALSSDSDEVRWRLCGRRDRRCCVCLSEEGHNRQEMLLPFGLCATEHLSAFFFWFLLAQEDQSTPAAAVAWLCRDCSVTMQHAEAALVRSSYDIPYTVEQLTMQVLTQQQQQQHKQRPIFTEVSGRPDVRIHTPPQGG